MIGHTQPRRLAARTVAARIAEELHTEIGGAVGWKVRFTDQVGENTLVKLMTDGILLAELAGDRMLRQYDTLIIDEAHERSLNIDFILGYLAQLLPRRPDLKVIITSATIDPERFAAHFATDGVPAPIVEVSGRSFPVEVRYRPVVDPDDPDSDPDRDQLDAIGDAVAELRREGPGDILVFLPGEREIRDTADALAKRDSAAGTEILPLYARLSTAEQQRVFAPRRPRGRRVVLATNVAETSLTVPGHPLRDRPRHSPASPATRAGSRCSGCRSRRSPRPAPTSGPGAAAASPTASASGSTPRTTSTPARSSPTRRSCAPTWPRSSCR